LDNTTMTATLLVNQVPAISSAASTTFALGQAGSFTVTTTGYPLPAITKSGALPSGVAFVDNGDGTATLAGTPAAGSAGVYSLSVTAANGVNPAATQTLTLTVGQAPAFTSAATATFTAGTAGSATVTTSGAPAATITATGSLPNGVTFVDNGGGTATLSGTPAAGTGGTYPLTLSASNGVGPNAAQSFTLTVREAPTVTAQPSAQTVYPGDSATFTAAASGTPTPTVQWQRSTNGGTSFGDVAGATSPTYTFATVSTDDGNRYRAVFTNAAGTVQTSVVTLTVGTGPLTAVVITPSASSVAAGAAASYTADGRDVRGNSLGDATVATTFTIAAAGSGSSTGASCVQATGGSPASCSATIAGTYTVTGVDGAAADTATLTVTAGPLATLTVSPAWSSIAAGTSRTYAASGADAYGNSLGDVTSSTTFTIAPSSGGSPTGAGCTTAAGCTATIVGTYTVTGTDGSVTGVATLAVTPSALASLSLTPPTASVSAGTAQSYAVTGADAYGNTWGDVTSASSFTIAPATGGSATGASCGTNGSCTATAAGDYTVTATDGGVTGTAGVTIVPSSLASITVSPGTASAAAGAALPYAATGADTYGNSLGDVTAATVFTIAPSGTTGSASGASCTSASLCTATAVGSYTVTGTDGAVTATATVTVTPAPLAALVISPAAPSAVAGTSTSFTAEGVDAYGNSRGDDTGVTTFTIAPAAGGSAAGAVCTGAACTATATGGYTIAGADGAATGTAQLTVTAAAAASITATSGGGQIAYLGSPFAQPLVATVLDAFGNPVPGSVVTFTVPAAGGGNGAATFPGALTTVSVTTGADGVATSPALVAGASAGAVVVSAAIGGSAPSVTYPASSVVAVVVPTPTPTPTPNPTPPPTRPSAPKGPSGIGTAGTVTVITGTTTPGARVELYGFTVPSTTYHLLGWTRANAVGHYSFLPRFTGNSRVYVRVAGLTSPSIVVRVRSLVTLSATKLSPRTYTFSGASLPARAGELVVLYYRDRFGHALVVARAHADGHGHYSVTHTFTDYGRHSYGIFAVVSSDARAVWATSRTDAITTYRAY
jgi:hypothetical protein